MNNFQRIKVFHTADIQIEVRNQQQRADEFRFILNELEKGIISKRAELYLIVGDIFEVCKPNDVERSIFIEHLKHVSQIDTLKEIIITHGNHDVDQRQESNFFISAEGKIPSYNSLDTIVNSLGNEKIHLLDKSTRYESKAFPGLVYYNWSQKTKHSAVVNEHYNPLENFDINSETCKCAVTLYHDPIYGCTMFDGKKLPSNEKLSKLSVFGTNTIFAGDIHQPQNVSSGRTKLIYPGSPVARNFGEGDYYRNGKLTQCGTLSHTYCYGELLGDGLFTSQEWVRVPQYRGYSTFEITNEVLPEDVCKHNFIIENKGLYENLVKVKLPSSSESWIAKQADIIDEIRKQNPDANIVNIYFTYGKGLDINNDIKKNIDIKEIITQEKIIEVAKEYIHSQVQSSKSIPVDDKEKVENTINEIFISQIKNINNLSTGNVISLQSMHINNFMAFGKNNDISFNELNGITKLTGGNGIGKTTLYKAIKWVLTGYISQNQNRTKKNENNLAVFNDYLFDEPSVEVTLTLNINNELRKITRNATREWKKNVGVEEKSSDKWKSYVASTTSNVIVYNEANEIVYRNESAEEWLEHVFGGLENLERIVFVDQFTLRSFVCSEPLKLCEEILSHMGLNFFDEMNNQYEKVRSTELGKMSKVSFTVDELTASITRKKNERSEYENTVDNLIKKKDELISVITEIEKVIYETSLKIYPNISEDIISEKKKNAEDSLNEQKVLLEKLEASLKIINKLLEEQPIESIKKLLNEKETNVKTLLDVISKKKQELSDYQVLVAQYENSIISRKNEISEARHTEIENINKELSTVKEQVAKINEKLIELKNNLSNSLTTYLNDIDSKITASKNVLEKTQLIKSQQVEKLEKENEIIDELKNSRICPTCKRPLDTHSIEEINKKIATSETTKASIVEIINKCNKKIEETEKTISELEKQKEHYKEHPEELDFYEKDSITITKTTELLSRKKEHIVELEKKIETIKSNIEKEYETDETLLKIKCDKESIEITLINTIQKEIDNNIKKLETANKEVDEAKEWYDNVLAKESTKNKTEQDILKVKMNMKEHENVLDNIESDYLKLSSNIENQKIIDEKKKEEKEKEEEKNNIENDINYYKEKITLCDSNIERYSNDRECAIAYRIVETSLKQYKTLIGKSGLPQYIFGIIRPMLNDKLNDLLEDLNFRLIFNDDNQLVMVDLSKDTVPMRYPSQFSGMQTCFSGLSLIYVNRICNNSFIFDNLFIDEISGQLNSGEELQYESLNYQEQLKSLLRKFENLNIWIVDHVIKDFGEDNTFEVMPTKKGTIIQRLK